MHGLIFWGVLIQTIGTAINLMQMRLFTPFELTNFPRGQAYLIYELVMDSAGFFILLGVGMAALRRLIWKPQSLDTRWDDVYALVILTLIPLAGFTTEAFRFIANPVEWANWSPFGHLWSKLLISVGVTPALAASLHDALFWVHVSLALTFGATIPFTKLRHLVLAPANILFRPHKKAGELTKIENIEEAEVLGVGAIDQFSSAQLLSFETCVRCGRCEEACPATLSGMPYSPKQLIQSLRSAMVYSLIYGNGNGRRELLGEVLPKDFPWYCTTCGACLKRCPTFANPVEQVVDLRRYQVLTTGEVKKSVGDVLRNLERQGNPWGMPAADRVAWAKDLAIRQLSPGEETDVLLFLGCAFAYDDRNKKVAQSLVGLLQKAGVDFAILGLDETCCGETARRMGNEYLFQLLAQQNIETFSKVKFNRIVTPCPHCFNTLKNEYPQLGGDYQVLHYTEFLMHLDLPWEKIAPNSKGVSKKVAYHDSCYLGRYNDIYKQPRQLLRNARVETVELARNYENSFCCGGGGGQMWLESDAETRINHRRLEEVLNTHASCIATACPYCLIMFDDAVRSKGLSEIQVMDISEIVAQRISA
ncbi:MAG: heterodisulfide reductase-related iron-sulfur binding cluster [Anaerolineales bacterium]|nr:heterodisulfide reductase-related iron-sulfur binding cluster [Anaerolineales bacterium]MDW8160922.1 heterodisulfide reductase-related iron-sulfur binding cluster [Anaerolineales bacterium]